MAFRWQADDGPLSRHVDQCGILSFVLYLLARSIINIMPGSAKLEILNQMIQKNIGLESGT